MPLDSGEGILHHHESAELFTCGIDLTVKEFALISVFNRERLLKNLIKQVKSNYDYILIDCPSSHGILTIDAITIVNKSILPFFTVDSFANAFGEALCAGVF